MTGRRSLVPAWEALCSIIVCVAYGVLATWWPLRGFIWPFVGVVALLAWGASIFWRMHIEDRRPSQLAKAIDLIQAIVAEGAPHTDAGGNTVHPWALTDGEIRSRARAFLAAHDRLGEV